MGTIAAGTGPGARRRRLRGYTLVEIAIVLAASALLASGPLLLMYNKVLDDNYASARRQLEEAKGRIVDYAASRRTPARLVSNSPELRPNFLTAEGRPHLPCPDLDGDGIEDRDVAGTEILNDNQLRPLADSRGPFITGHRCAGWIGFLPHVTLGARPKDPFGNRLLYAVDMLMSDAAYGFDDRSSPSSYDERRPAEFMRSGDDAWLEYPLRADSSLPQPPVLCLGHTAGSTDGRCRFGDRQGEILATAATVTVELPDELGSVRRVFAGTPGAAEIADDGVIEGLAFVVLSAGRYRQGALHLGGRCVAGDPGAAPGGADPSGDSYNYWLLYHELCAASPATDSPLIYAVREPVAYGGGNALGRLGDDQAGWMSAADLSGEMERLGVYPVKRQPLVLADYAALRDDRAQSRFGLRPSLLTVGADAAAVRIAHLVEDLPLALLGGLTVTLPPGGYVLSSGSAMTPRRPPPAAWAFRCAGGEVCAILPAGGIRERALVLLMDTDPDAAFDVTLPIGLQPLRVVAGARVLAAEIRPW